MTQLSWLMISIVSFAAGSVLSSLIWWARSDDIDDEDQ